MGVGKEAIERGGLTKEDPAGPRVSPRWDATCMEDVSTGETRFGLHFERLHLLIWGNGL